MGTGAGADCRRYGQEVPAAAAPKPSFGALTRPFRDIGRVRPRAPLTGTYGRRRSLAPADYWAHVMGGLATKDRRL